MDGFWGSIATKSRWIPYLCRRGGHLFSAERVMFATECDRHEGHHINSEFGITEILDAQNQPAIDGQPGYIVGTSLHNYGMPLLRYKTSDISSIKTVACTCGRVLPLMEDVTTKAEDCLSLRDGRVISPSVLTHPFKPMHSVEASQVVQVDQDNIIIRIIPNSHFNESDEAYLIAEFHKRLGENINIKIVLVDELERTRSGKFKWVISNVKLAV